LFCRTDKEEVSAKEILDFLRERLEPFKVPEHVHFVEKLPWTTTGKMDRNAMRRALERQ
jgi:acyl-coenzyme A synthetase/AMP-(fatty) acid ligase